MAYVQRVFYIGLAPTATDQQGLIAHWVSFTGANGVAPSFINPVDGVMENVGNIKVTGMYGSDGRQFVAGDVFDPLTVGYARILAPQKTALPLGRIDLFGEGSTSAFNNFEQAVLSAGPEYFWRLDESTGTAAANLGTGVGTLYYGGTADVTATTPTTADGLGQAHSIGGVSGNNIYDFVLPEALLGPTYYREADFGSSGIYSFDHNIQNLTQSSRALFVLGHTTNFSIRVYDDVYQTDFFKYWRMGDSDSFQDVEGATIESITDTQFQIDYDNNGTDIDDGDHTWWFLKQDPDFFEIVSYAGSGVANNLTLSLNNAPCMIIFHRRFNDTSGNNTFVWMAGMGADYGTDTVDLIYTQPSLANQMHISTANSLTNPPTTTAIPLGSGSSLNWSARTYTAYVFAADGANITTGTYVGGGTPTVNTGFAPGLIWIKSTTDNTEPWVVIDKYRNQDVGASYLHLARNSAEPSTNYQEVTTGPTVTFSPTGFTINSAAAPISDSGTYTYVAFRDTRV